MIPKPFAGRVALADEMNAEQKASFQGAHQTLLLPAGFELWRFASQKNHGRFGAFWMDAATMTSIMQMTHINGNFTQQYKKENVRNSLAVLEGWSHLNMRIKIRLTREVLAYVGQTGRQRKEQHVKNEMPFGGGDTILRITETRRGGHVQYVIPRFKGLPDRNDWARIELEVHI